MNFLEPVFLINAFIKDINSPPLTSKTFKINSKKSILINCSFSLLF